MQTRSKNPVRTDSVPSLTAVETPEPSTFTGHTVPTALAPQPHGWPHPGYSTVRALLSAKNPENSKNSKFRVGKDRGDLRNMENSKNLVELGMFMGQMALFFRSNGLVFLGQMALF